MQIHELNNFTGTLGSGAYLAVDDGNDTGKLSTQQLLAATEARIDNIIAGPAPSAEEIVDARYGADGVTYPSLGDAIRDQVSDLKDDINEMRDETHTDLLYGQPTIAKWFIDSSTGEGRTLNDFYSYVDIDIPDNVVRLYPYNNSAATINYIRTVCFYDANGDFISGQGGNATTVAQGIEVPNNAKKVACTLTYPSTGYDGKHYLSTVIGGDIVTYPLSDKVEMKSSQLILDAQTDNNIRKACINFQFDDGDPKDADIVSIFDDYGYKCGFALIAGNSLTTAGARYLGYQNKGYEILSHSIDSTGMNDTSVDPSVIENKLKTSKELLEKYQFNIKGFVTPSSIMAESFRPILRKYYQWAETEYYGAYTGETRPDMTPMDGVYNGWRISLQLTTVANQKAAVDACIANQGCLTFYGHAAALDTTDYLTTANLNELLTYIQTKEANGECIVGTPSEVIENYFAVRNDDISDGWVTVKSTEVSLDARFSVNSWMMKYNEKLGLLTFAIRVAPTEAVSGQLQLFTFPKAVYERQLVLNEANRIAFPYNGKLLITGSNTWASGTNYMFSGMLKLQ